MTEKYNLNWHTFSEHLQFMFKDLYEEEKHSDVTLVCDNQTQFKAHKIVLSACSPVFKKIIDNNRSQHPLIYLRGIQSYEMESILQFMYLGEGRFYSERMGEFIKVAKDLEVKEISKGVEMQNEEEDVTEETVFDEDQVSTQESVQKNIQSKHEGIKYPCNQCDYQATHQSSLQTHIAAKHSDNILQCELCDYQTKWRYHYIAHKKAHTTIEV